MVALKMLPAYLTGDPETVQRFQQEARAASGVSHPNVAHVYEIDSAVDRHYIAMEYVECSTLRQLLGPESLSVGGAVEVALQVANALAAARARRHPPRHQTRKYHGRSRRTRRGGDSETAPQNAAVLYFIRVK